jgi:hypothetical protein
MKALFRIAALSFFMVAIWAFLFGLRSQSKAEKGSLFVEVPDPLSGNNPTYPLISRPVPEPGKPFKDARFQTTLTRVTQGKGMRHEYARFDPFNADHSMIVLPLVESGDFRVYGTGTLPYDRDSNMVKKFLGLEEPRWDPVKPNLIWGLRDFQIVWVDCTTGKTTIIKDFSKDPTIGPILKAEPDLYRVTTKHEGEASRDMRFWALLLQGTKEEYRLRYVFTWDREEDRVLGIYKLSAQEAEVDWVGMSPLGNWVLIGSDSGKGKHAGLTMADKGLKRFHQLAHATAHSDVGLDANGREILVMQNSRTDHIDLIPIDWKTRPVTEDDAYPGSNRTPLVRLFYSSEAPYGLKSGVHISCNVPGWCVVSTYIAPGEKEQNWLDRSIILIKLDPLHPKAYYLAKVHNTCGAYWEETQATITKDGAKVLWASNWSQQVGKEQTFLVQLDMPKNWRNLLK